MAKKSGSKSSRSERRAGRKRAERAVEHGLPTRKVPPPRARAATPQPGSHREGTDRSSDAPPAPSAKSGGVPTLVKVLGAALVILVGVYLLSRQRDEALTENKPAPETALAASAAPAVEAAAEPSTLPPSPEVTAAPQPAAPAAIVSVTPPTKPVVAVPVVAAPVVSAPSKPKVEKAAVARAPSSAAAPTAPVAPAVPAPVAAPAVPTAAKPAPPKAPPVDNPY